MQHIKIIELTNQLPTDDLEKIAGYFNSIRKIKPPLLGLFRTLLKNRLTQKENTKEQLWRVVFGKQKLNENLFRKLCFELLKEIEQTLPLLQVEQNETENKLQLLHYLSGQAGEDYFEDKWNKVRTDKFHENILLSSNQSFFNYSLELIRYDFLGSNPSKAKTNNISATSVTLDEYYILQKLKLICHAVNEEKFTTYTEKPLFHEYVIEMAKTVKTPLTDLYLHIYTLLTSADSREIFNTVKQELEILDYIDEKEWRIIFQYVINYCIIQLNKGYPDFEQELLYIYRYYLEKINDEIFSPFRYKNIINLSLKLKQYSFAAAFIEEYGKRLPKELRQTSIAFNKAKLNYELRKYDTVIETLQNVKTEDITFNLSSKVLLVKTFYDKKEFLFLESFLESFRVYVLRNRQMNTTTKKTHLDFIKTTKKLMALGYKSQKEISDFTDKINKLENLTDKTWLLEKINQL